MYKQLLMAAVPLYRNLDVRVRYFGCTSTDVANLNMYSMS